MNDSSSHRRLSRTLLAAPPEDAASGGGDPFLAQSAGAAGPGAAARRFGPEGAPAQFGPYRVERLLGKGGMGQVFLGYDPQLQRRVALNVIRGDYTADAELVERLRREARVAAQLSHSGIVAVHAMGEREDQIFIAMEYVEGQDLSNWVKERGPMPAPRAN